MQITTYTTRWRLEHFKRRYQNFSFKLDTVDIASGAGCLDVDIFIIYNIYIRRCSI